MPMPVGSVSGAVHGSAGLSAYRVDQYNQRHSRNSVDAGACPALAAGLDICGLSGLGLRDKPYGGVRAFEGIADAHSGQRDGRDELEESAGGGDREVRACHLFF